MGMIAFVAVLIFNKISKSADKAAEREHEIRKLQIQEGFHASNPKAFVELDRLQRQFGLIGMGIRGGWIPFVMMYIYSMNSASVSVDGESQSYSSSIPSVAVIIGLIVFYGFLFNRAFSINAKIHETTAEIQIESKESKD